MTELVATADASSTGAGLVDQLPPPNSLRAWILAIRPKTLVAGWAPVLVGASLALVAGGGFLPLRAAGALVVALMIQICTNLVNDAADHERGADTADRLGPPRAAALGLLAPRALYRGAMVAAAVAGLTGVWLASQAGWWLLIPGGLAIAAAVGYTAGPRPLAYAGLGEIFVFVFFGIFATIGTYIVLAGPISFLQVFGVAGVSMGLFSVAILEVNNVRDAPQDALAGKRTLAVRLGDARARSLLGWCLVGAPAVWLVAPSVLAILMLSLREGSGSPPWWVVAAWLILALPVLFVVPAVRLRRVVRGGASGTDLNPVLGRVARLMGAFAVSVSLTSIASLAWFQTMAVAQASTSGIIK